MINPSTRWKGLNVWVAGAWIGLGLLAGCAHAPAWPPVDLNAPGWKVHEAAAIWRPQRAAPELFGELIIALRSDGARLIQFSKQGLPVVTARVEDGRWLISSALRPGRYGGGLPAPSQILWFRLDDAPPSPGSVAPWQLTVDSEHHRWTLQNPQSGESLEVVESDSSAAARSPSSVSLAEMRSLLVSEAGLR